MKHTRAVAVVVLLSLNAAAFGEVKWGFIDTGGRMVIAPQFENARPFSEGRAAVQIDGYWNYIDRIGKRVTPAAYPKVGDFSCGRAWVKSGPTMRCIDSAGRRVFDLTCDEYECGDFSESLAAVDFDGSWGFVDCAGKLVIGAEFSDAGRFSEGLAPVRARDSLSGKYAWGYIGRDGRFVLPPVYKSAGEFACGRALVRTDGGQFHIDRRGNRCGNCASDSVWFAGGFSDGRAFFGTTGELYGPKGYIDTTGRVAIPARYDLCGTFSEGLATAYYSGKKAWGYIDRSGREVIAPQFAMALGFCEGRAYVVMDVPGPSGGTLSRRGFIDRTGKLVVQPIYYEAGHFSEGLAPVAVEVKDE